MSYAFTPNTFVFQPGGFATGIVFNDWMKLHAVLMTAAGPKTVQVDDSFAPASIPIGIWDMTDTTLEAFVLKPSAPMTLTLPDGSVLRNLTALSNGLNVIAQATTTPNFQIPNSNSLRIDLGASIDNQGTEPIVRLAGGDVVAIAFILGTFTPTSAPLVDMPILGATTILVAVTNSNFSGGNNVVTGIAGTTLILLYDAGVQALPTNPGFAGATGSSPIDTAFFVGYTPTVPGDWSPIPANVGSALDELAARTPHPATWTQADWYVDWVLGNDSNDGTTPGTAVKTVMGGVVNKWGTNSPELPQTTTLHILTPQPLGAEVIFLEPILVGPFTFNIVGTKTPVASYVLVAVTSKNRPTNTQFDATFPVAVTPGELLVNTTALKDSHCFVRSSAGVVSQLSQPLAPIAVGSVIVQPAPAEVDAWMAGDTVDVFDLPILNLCVLRVTCTVSDLAQTAPGLWLQSLHVPDPSGSPGFTEFAPVAEGGYVVLNDVSVDAFLKTPIQGVEQRGGGGSVLTTALVQCYLNGGGSGSAYIFGGIVNQFAFIGSGFLDGDVILDVGSTGGTDAFVFGGFVNVASALIGLSSCSFILAGIWWGLGTLNVTKTSLVQNNRGDHSWTNGLFVATLHINNSATGTKYVAGVFTDGVLVTPANLDAFGGLQDVINGARYTTL